ncbi:endonuclease III [Xanthobacter aminoxidans]|uniref:Endonuclease III n=1 Tax=Xanthobacter aminoxidans TaxID=186280 RepID=A0ABW6ZF90_9HYPH
MPRRINPPKPAVLPEADAAKPPRPTRATKGAKVAAGASGTTGKGAKAPAKGKAAKAPASGTAKAAPASKASGGKTSSGTKPTGKTAAPLPRRNKAVANAAAAVHGRTVSPWSDAEITEAFTRFEAQDPEPKGELDHTDAFTLLVAVVLSAQATDTGVNKATKGLFAAASTPAAMVALGEDQVAHHIRTLGLFRGKAKNVVELSRLLLERHAGVVPRDREALEALPGVGRKTANVVLNIAFGVPTIAVDTHLFRVANRTGLAPGATPLAVELGLEARIPDRFKLHAHHWLILHGRYICKATKPACSRCLITDLCRWPEKNF